MATMLMRSGFASGCRPKAAATASAAHQMPMVSASHASGELDIQSVSAARSLISPVPVVDRYDRAFHGRGHC
jgi:hypothetical protein